MGNSRYGLTRYIPFPDKEKGMVKIYKKRKILELVSNGTVEKHTIKQGERLDQLAFEYYRDPTLWWVILDINPKYMTPMDIKPGDILNIPTEETLRRSVQNVYLT